MAYNPYNPYAFNNPPMGYMQTPTPVAPTQPQTQTQNQTIQNSGFISVPSEEVARNWPVAPGNSVTFKNENAPFVYTKTMGFSQLDRPSFEKFRLVKEADAPESIDPVQTEPTQYALEKDLDAMRNTMKHMKSDIDMLKAKLDKRPNQKRREVTDGE